MVLINAIFTVESVDICVAFSFYAYTLMTI